MAGRPGCWRRWPGCMCAGWWWTGRRCWVPVSGWSCRRPRSGTSGSGRSRPRSRSRSRAGTGRRRRRGSGRRVTAGVCGGRRGRRGSRHGGGAGALALDERAGLDQVLPALASWRRRERDAEVTAGWRYRVSWVPVPELDLPVLRGTWLVVVPAGQAGELAQGCVRALESRGAGVVLIETAAETGREVLAARISQVLAGAGDPQLSGVLSLLALDEEPLAGFPVVPGGLAATVDLLQALGDAEAGAPLWLLTQGAVV